MTFIIVLMLGSGDWISLRSSVGLKNKQANFSSLRYAEPLSLRKRPGSHAVHHSHEKTTHFRVDFSWLRLQVMNYLLLR